MDDDPDMVNSGATEMVPVSMLNTRSIAAMEESLPEDGTQDEMDDSSDDSIGPGKLKRKIDRYPNPFGPNVSDMDEQEDDEGWLGSGADCSENGETKSNSDLGYHSHKRNCDGAKCYAGIVRCARWTIAICFIKPRRAKDSHRPNGSF
ncbi:hypothetical protein BGZ68_003502 [Mortierella alpina]|nr:hypothetical protein BGZ68_003502 [Mortierella alpina]